MCLGTFSRRGAVASATIYLCAECASLRSAFLFHRTQFPMKQKRIRNCPDSFLCTAYSSSSSSATMAPMVPNILVTTDTTTNNTSSRIQPRKIMMSICKLLRSYLILKQPAHTHNYPKYNTGHTASKEEWLIVCSV